ncbi:MAG: LamG-like jellyroll fold domain-containing protein, partial [Candidatus Bipolaricaulota bacterium]|nr:LamG-like jellyroll fold domain-containing protein [Candidatus Bipolaricaulota bacterium]
METIQRLIFVFVLAIGGVCSCLGQGYSLRFFGNGVNDIDRVKIRVDDPSNNLPGPPADIGATDFTIEFWMKATAAENPAPTVSCGWNVNWIYGNIIIDRDRFAQDRKFGLSVAGGRIVFGVSGNGTGDFTICGTSNVLDGQWHHVAVQRRRADGYLWLYVDGRLEAQGDGPDGDV